MEYVVIADRSLTDFQVRVNGALKDGYELHGGLAVNNNFYCQAVVKKGQSLKEFEDEIQKRFTGSNNAGVLDITQEPKLKGVKPTGNFNPGWDMPPDHPTETPKKRSHKKKT